MNLGQSNIKMAFNVAVIVSMLWALYLYYPAHYYFLNDDFIHIPLSKQGQLFQRHSFRPLSDLSVTLDYRLWHQQAWGYHLTNLLLHLANCVLLYVFVRRLLVHYSYVADGKKEGLLTAMLFFVNASHSESVFWILGRSASLGCMFFLIACILFLMRNRHVVYFVAGLLAFAAGALAYEAVWIFPPATALLAFMDVRLQRSTKKRELVYQFFIWLVFAGYLAARYTIISEIAGPYEASRFFNLQLGELLLNGFKLAVRAFVPAITGSWVFLVAVATYILLLVLGFLGNFRFTWFIIIRWVLMLVLVLFLLSVTPYLSLGVDTRGVEGERFLYMPTLFACLLLVLVMSGIAQAGYRQLAFLLVLMFNLAMLTRAAGFYKTASGITRNTMAAVNQLQGKQHLLVDSLPVAFHGALIFRLGFNEGVRWLRQPGTVDTVSVLSQKINNNQWQRPYRVVQQPADTTFVIDTLLVPDVTHQRTYVAQPVPPTRFNRHTQARFVFGSGKLMVQQ